MTATEKRQAIVKKLISREGKNTYTQGDKRDQVATGYSDCSSLTQWAHKEILGISIGSNTEAQIQSSKLTTIEAGIKNGIPDESKLLPGDVLYFRGRDASRKATGYVGHVEMYVGNGQISGHGSGIGPTRKSLMDYCRTRQSDAVATPIGNRGLICVRRAVPADASDHNEWTDKLTELYITQLGRLPDAGGLACWSAHLAGGATWESVANAVIDSQEGRERYVRELYTYLLYREPDAEGKKHWLNLLSTGMTRAEVYKGFLNSPEYKPKS